MKWNIKNIEIKNRIVLAPMAGISNPAYIKICEDMGVGYAVSELISSEAIVRNNKKTLEMLKGIDDIKIPLAIQIFGSDPLVMARAAKFLVDEYSVKIIDINLGCPVPKVAIKARAGSALLKEPKKVYDIVKSVVSAIDVPVTVKIRSGWDSNHINAIEIAKICESAGASAIAVHPRTRALGYAGRADWNIIKSVKESVKIPVIGNGDVLTSEDFNNMLIQTNCDAVMIGRGLLGNPWLIREILANQKGEIIPEPTLEERISMIKKHYELLLKYKPSKLALLELRTNIAKYLKGLPNSSEIKTRLFTASSGEELFKILDDYYDACS